jgi:hypothetical protein
MEISTRSLRAAVRGALSLAASIGASAFLFQYLSETVIQWRIALSMLLFLATFVMIDGLLERE